MQKEEKNLIISQTTQENIYKICQTQPSNPLFNPKPSIKPCNNFNKCGCKFCLMYKYRFQEKLNLQISIFCSPAVLKCMTQEQTHFSGFPQFYRKFRSCDCGKPDWEFNLIHKTTAT